MKGKFFEKAQNGKKPTKLDIIYGIKIKRREARQNWKEEKKAIEKKVTECQWKWEESSKKEKCKKEG